MAPGMVTASGPPGRDRGEAAGAEVGGVESAAGARPEPLRAMTRSSPGGLSSTKQSPPMPVICGSADAEEHGAGDGGVHGVAAVLQDADGGGGGQRVGGRAHAVRGEDGRAAGFLEIAHGASPFVIAADVMSPCGGSQWGSGGEGW